jgi:hypothetical protein
MPEDMRPMTFTQALAKLEACKDGPWTESGAMTHGSCSDGKRFFEQHGGFSGRRHLYRGEQLVGIQAWVDVGRGECAGYVRCAVIERIGLCGTPIEMFQQ